MIKITGGDEDFQEQGPHEARVLLGGQPGSRVQEKHQSGTDEGKEKSLGGYSHRWDLERDSVGRGRRHPRAERWAKLERLELEDLFGPAPSYRQESAVSGAEKGSSGHSVDTHVPDGVCARTSAAPSSRPTPCSQQYLAPRNIIATWEVRKQTWRSRVVHIRSHT